MKKLLILTLFLGSFISSAQNKKLDSLYQALENHPQRDTVRFKLLLNISRYSRNNPATTKDFAEQALELAQELKFASGIFDAQFKLATYYISLANYAKAQEYAFKLLKDSENNGNRKVIYKCTQLIADIYMRWNDYEKANEYYNRLLEYANANPDIVDFEILYHNLGIWYNKQKKFSEGIQYLNKSIAISNEKNNSYMLSFSSYEMAKAQFALTFYEASLKNYQRAISLARSSRNDLGLIVSAHIGIGEILIETGHFNKASLHLDTALKGGKTIKDRKAIIKIYNKKTRIYEEQRDYKAALKYERLYKELSDSIFNSQNAQQLAEVQTRYETEKKEQAIMLLEQRAEAQGLLRNSLIVGLLLTMITGSAIYRLQRFRTRNAKQLLETQQLLNRQMQEADKLKSRFFANISHEFRTPLTLILSPVEEKLMIEDLSQKDKISFQAIRRSANRLLELINQLLELSKLESGFMKLKTQPGNLYSFIMPILSSFDSMADVGQVKYSKEVRVPESAVLFDSDKLEKILNNLLSNAFKFSPRAGSVEVRAIAQEKEKSIELEIEIKNTSFISPDTLDKIFEPFYQGEDMPARVVPGTGLGLSLVKELVKLHGSIIRVASTVSDGTVFTVALSLEKTDVPAVAQANEKTNTIAFVEELSENIATETDAGKETILIVEDNQDVRTVIRQGLQAYYNILEAPSGSEGLDIAHNNNVDMVVSDVMMPLMNGIELCHLLKNDELTSHIPVILLTARADHESKLEGLRTGADDYVVKPFNMQELQARIVNLIEQRKKLIRKYNQRVVVQPHEITVTSLDERFLQKVIQVVEGNLDNPDLSVDKVSEALGMSRTNLHRKLKSVTGLATGEFVQDFRMRRAAQLIEKKADTIAQIAYQVGFNDQSYFTKCFKKKFGKTPSEFAQGTHGITGAG